MSDMWDPKEGELRKRAGMERAACSKISKYRYAVLRPLSRKLANMGHLVSSDSARQIADRLGLPGFENTGPGGGKDFGALLCGMRKELWMVNAVHINGLVHSHGHEVSAYASRVVYPTQADVDRVKPIVYEPPPLAVWNSEAYKDFRKECCDLIGVSFDDLEAERKKKSMHWHVVYVGTATDEDILYRMEQSLPHNSKMDAQTTLKSIRNAIKARGVKFIRRDWDIQKLVPKETTNGQEETKHDDSGPTGDNSPVGSGQDGSLTGK